MSNPTSTLGIIDTALKGVLFTRFQTTMGLVDTSMVCFYPEEVAQREFSEKQGKSEVDFISFFRVGNSFAWDRNRTPVSVEGMGLNYTTSAMTTTVFATAVPVDLLYEVVFWHHDLNTVNEIMNKWFFWVQQNPLINVELGGYPLNIYMHFKTVEDHSTIRNMYKVGKYWVYKAYISAESWLVDFDSSGTIGQIIVNCWYKQDGIAENINLFNFTLP